MRRDVFQAIADPTRRAILALLIMQPMTQNLLVDQFEISRQAVSKHLKILSDCEMIKEESKGREVYYRLKIDKLKEIDIWLEQFRKVWETRFSQLDDLLLKTRTRKKNET
ncbi:MAG: winged helix-turn-helix transcriptional regulator [Leptospiraceae bacterium]|nr:winged helix-turn-helix transcriptional regulator [Leptospiraceae bacterium]